MKRNKYAVKVLKSVFLVFISVIGYGSFTPLYTSAQSTSKIADSISKVNELNEVMVRKIKAGKRQTSSTPLQILSGSDLEKLNSLSVADAVRFFSGVQLKDYGGIGGLKTVNVRSMGTNHTSVFYDGVQLGNAQNGQVDLGKFSLDNIEEIELYNGQKSTVFQSAKGFASGSSLYLHTHEPVFEQGRTDQVKASLKSGSFGLFSPALLWFKKFNDQLYSSFSANYSDAHGRYKFNSSNGYRDTTIVRQNGDLRRLRMEAGLYGILPDSSKWNAKIYFYNDRQGLPGAIVSNRYNFSQRLWNRNFFFQSNYKKETGRYNLMISGKYAYDYLRYLDPDLVREDGLTNNIFKQQEIYVTVVNKYAFSPIWNMVLSTDYQRQTLDANLFRFAYPTRHTLLAALATEVNLSRFNLQANLLGTLVYDKVKQYYSAGNKSELTPTIMASWQPFASKELRIRSFYKSIFRMPTFNDLYYTTVGSTFLQPERTGQYDVGLTYVKIFERGVLSQFSLQSDIYYNTVKDKIIAVPGANLFRWSIQNLGKVDIRGLDINLQSLWKAGSVATVNAGLVYTYQRALNTSDAGVDDRNQIPYVPRHSGSVVTRVDFKQIALNYSFIYTGAHYSQSANIPVNYLEPWYVHDLAVHYSHAIRKQKYKLSVEVNNLFDQYYDVVANFPMPGRSYRFTLTYAY